MQTETTKDENGTDVGGRVDPLVSLRITDDTELTQKADMFGDGPDGYFMQQYTLYADEKDTGVSMTVEGHMGKDDATRIFFAAGQGFDDIKDVFVAAGHKWLRAS